MNHLLSSKGVSLIELMIGSAITGVIALSVIQFSQSSTRNQLNSIQRSQAETQMRAFMEATKKHISLSRNPYSGNTGSLLDAAFQNRNCSFLISGTPSLKNCGDPKLQFSKLMIDRFGQAENPSTYFTETISTECLPKPSYWRIDATTHAKITECSICKNTELPVVRIRFSNQPQLTLRFSGGAESPTSANIAEDGIAVASNLCVTHSPMVTSDPQSFQTLTLRLRTLVKQSPNEVKLLELSAAVPLPQPISGGVRVLSTQ
jgi:Tfp pilus assembly protein PilE